MANRDYFRLLTSKTFKEANRIPTAQETLAKQTKALKTKYGFLSLGAGSDGECLVTQEERESHFHIIGAPGEGKSKLLEMMICRDIDRIRNPKEKGPGLCLIDPSEYGDTMKKVLGYCEKVGFKKVLIVDPDSRFKYKKIAPINPVHTDPSLVNKSVASLTDAFRVIFGVKRSEAGKYAYLENYLPALFKILSTAKLTLNDLRFFTDINDELRREIVFAMSDAFHDIRKLRFAYKNIPLFTQEIGSTVRRIETVFRDEGLDLMFSHRKAVDFAKLIADRWVILVNVSGLDVLPSRLLASTVVNEVIFGIDRLRSNGWDGYFYLYIDEAGRYATEKIADILEYKRKIGLRLILSHQYMGQFEDKAIADSIRSNAKIKVAFYIADREERDRVIKMMYGGQLEDREVSYALSQQAKQEAVVKLPKGSPKVIKVHDTPTYKVSESFIKSIYESPWYYTHQEITQDLHERYKGITAPVRPKPSRKGKVAKPKTTGKPTDKPKTFFDD